MADGSNIEWTDATWNPVVGCAKVAQGCKHCYAERMAKRLARMGQDHYAAVVNDTGWNGRAVTVPEALSKPLRWKKPRRIFVNSMSDLYHDDVPFEFIAAVYGVMAACPQHQFCILTKRPKRMREFMEWWAESVERARAVFPHDDDAWRRGQCLYGSMLHFSTRPREGMGQIALGEMGWPLPNVIHGYSASTQADLDAGMPDLLATPSALRCLSLEPLIGPIDVSACLGREPDHVSQGVRRLVPDGLQGGAGGPVGIHQIIVGGESGPRARPCNVAWIRAIVEQCRSADVACFVKQLGSRPAFDGMRYESTQREWGAEFRCKDPKGADPSEWPADLRIRQFPEVQA